MSPSEIKACYRLYAAHCLEIAQRLSDSGSKIALLNMAQTWKAEGVSRGGRPPSAFGQKQTLTSV